MCRCSISSELPATRGYVRTKLSSSSAQLCVRYNATDTSCFDATPFKDVPIGLIPSGSTEIYLKTNTSLPNGVLIVHGFGESISHLAKLIGPMTAMEKVHWSFIGAMIFDSTPFCYCWRRFTSALCMCKVNNESHMHIVQQCIYSPMLPGYMLSYHRIHDYY